MRCSTSRAAWPSRDRNGIDDKVGWTVGAGLEYAVSPAWSVKGEYLYVDLGSETFNTNLAAGGFPLASFTHTVKLTESIGRFGLNYKWGSPLVARY